MPTRRAASRLQRILNAEIDTVVARLKRSCPVKTGRLRNSIRQRGGRIAIRESRPRAIGPVQNLNRSVTIGGDTPYMQYVERYRFIISANARRLQQRLGDRSFTLTYRDVNITNVRDVSGRTARVFIRRLIMRRLRFQRFALRLARTGLFRATFTFPANRGGRIFANITITFNVASLVDVEDDGVRITIRYPRTLIPGYGPRLRILPRR